MDEQRNAAGARPRLAPLDMVRGSAVLLVVFMHTSLLFPDVHSFDDFNRLVAGIRIPSLMLISGFLTSSAIHDNAKLKSRALQFGWLVLIWGGLMAAVDALLGMGSPGSVGRAVVDYIIVPNNLLWFVWSLALMSLSLIPLRRVPSWSVLVVTAVVATVSFSRATSDSSIAIDHWTRFSVFFYLGAYFPAFLHRASKANWAQSMIALGFLLAAFAFDTWAQNKLGIQPFALPKRLLAVVVVLRLAFICGPIGVLARPLSWFGRNTLPIYVGQGALLPLAAAAHARHFTTVSIGIPLLAATVVGFCLALRSLAVRSDAQWLYAMPRQFEALFGNHPVRYGAPKNPAALGHTFDPS